MSDEYHWTITATLTDPEGRVIRRADVSHPRDYFQLTISDIMRACFVMDEDIDPIHVAACALYHVCLALEGEVAQSMRLVWEAVCDYRNTLDEKGVGGPDLMRSILRKKSAKPKS